MNAVPHTRSLATAALIVVSIGCGVDDGSAGPDGPPAPCPSVLAHGEGTRGNYVLYLWSVDGGRAVAVDDDVARPIEISRSIAIDQRHQRGAGLAVGGGIAWFRLTGGQPPSFQASGVRGVWRWDDDGMLVSVGGALARIAFGTNTLIQLAPGDPTGYWGYPAGSPDGSRLLAVRFDNGTAVIHEIAPDQTTRPLTGVPGTSLVGWSPDGAWFATIDRATRVMVVDATTLVAHEVASGSIDDAAWSSSEARLMVTGLIDGARRVVAMAPDGSDRVDVTTWRAPSPVAWGADGRQLLWVESAPSLATTMMTGDSHGLAKHAVGNPSPIRTVDGLWLVDPCLR